MLLYFYGRYLGNNEFDSSFIVTNAHYFRHLKKDNTYHIIYIIRGQKNFIIEAKLAIQDVLSLDDVTFVERVFIRMTYYMKEKQTIFIPFAYVKDDLHSLENLESLKILHDNVKPINSSIIVFKWIQLMKVDHVKHNNQLFTHVFPTTIDTTSYEANLHLQCDSFIKKKKPLLPVNMYLPHRECKLSHYQDQIILSNDTIMKEDKRYIHFNIKKNQFAERGDGTLSSLLYIETKSLVHIHIILRCHSDIRWIGEALRVSKKVTLSNYKPFL